jgi:D-beta-D-heptose 7-phosphate kinase/D-beta-D-heptose 1-phosphate adenosyltransferase
MNEISRTRAEKILRQFNRVKIMVVGDLMLDRFIWGDVSRISPEAPVPVVEITSESEMPGGSANVVNNISAIGAGSYVCGVIGKDYIGKLLRNKLSHKKIDLGGVIENPGRTTTLKTRIIAHNQQIVRVDKEDKKEKNGKDLKRIISYFHATVKKIDAVILEDYGKGMINQELVSAIIASAKKHDKIIAVDPKKGHALDYTGATVITPNKAEAVWMAGKEFEQKIDISAVGSHILNRWSCKGVLITLGEHGMALFQPGKKPVNIPTTAREVYDVSGAGDTVISTFTAALAAGADMKEAAVIANYAAGVVVGKVGTGTASRKEILNAIYSR